MVAGNQGMVETITTTMSQAILNVAHRKVGIALVGMWLLGEATTSEAQSLIFWLTVVALGSQLVQDVIEVLVTGKDLPESNNGNNNLPVVLSVKGETLETVKPVES